MFLPDINVLIALAWANHPQHQAAHDWFSVESSNGWGTCLLTQSGFLRLSLNPAVVGTMISPDNALKLLQSLVQHPHHQFVSSMPSLVDPGFLKLLRRMQGYRQTSDFVLRHLAEIHGLKLTTFDRGLAAAFSDVCLLNG